MRNRAVFALLILLLCLLPMGCPADENWQLLWKEQPLDAQALNPFSEQIFRTSGGKSFSFDYEGAKPANRFYLSLWETPETVQVSAWQGGGWQPLLSLKPERETMVLQLPEAASGRLRFQVTYARSTRCVLDGFCPLSGEDAAYSLPAAQSADELLVLPRCSDVDDQLSQRIVPGSAVVVLEKADLARQHACTLRLARLGLEQRPVFLQLKNTTGKEKNAQAIQKVWNGEASLTRTVRALCPLQLTALAEEGCATAQALESLFEACRGNALDPGYDADGNPEGRLWYVPNDPTLSRQAAQEESNRRLLQSLSDGYQADSAALPERWPAQPGEQVYADEEAGVWAYRSDTLQVDICRYTARNRPLVWYEAHIRTLGDERLHVGRVTQGKAAGKNMDPERLASLLQCVVAINTDYYPYREHYRITPGIIIRDGQVIHDESDKGKSQTFPPLSQLALYADGRLAAHDRGTYSAQEYLEQGATDVLSFGPVLVSGGRLRVIAGKGSRVKEPRSAIGMIEPGHYLAIVAEGRLNRSEGCTFQDMANLMYLRGVTEAMNLDGGNTSILLFMGQKLSRVGSLTSGKFTQSRGMQELLCAGWSSLVPAWEK